jgi:hypothetical protein
MFIELLLILSSSDPHYGLPPLSDARHLPPPADCAEQVRRHDRHLEYLQTLARAWPEKREHFDLWQAETARDRFLWGVLAEVSVSSRVDWKSHEQRRRELARWRWWVGESRYLERWAPPQIPEGLYPDKARGVMPGAQP